MGHRYNGSHTNDYANSTEKLNEDGESKLGEGGSVVATAFLRRAASEVLKSRSLIKGAYIFAYYIPRPSLALKGN